MDEDLVIVLLTHTLIGNTQLRESPNTIDPCRCEAIVDTGTKNPGHYGTRVFSSYQIAAT